MSAMLSDLYTVLRRHTVIIVGDKSLKCGTLSDVIFAFFVKLFRLMFFLTFLTNYANLFFCRFDVMTCTVQMAEVWQRR